MIGSRWRVAMAAAVLLACGWVGLQAEEGSQTKPESPKPDASAAPKKEPAPLSENVKRGLDYLVQQQDAGGGWGQGGGWRQGEKGRIEDKDVKDPPDVGNTCIAALALLRSGSTPKQGPYAANLTKAVQFITSHVDKSDGKSLYVTDLRGTQLQTKIGPYADTFLAGLVLSELKGRMPDQPGEDRLLAALNKTIHKIEINQKDDGTFAGNIGWASVLSQGLAGKALNRAKQAGAAVSEVTLGRDINGTVAQLDRKTGTFAAGGSAVGGPSARGFAGRSAYVVDGSSKAVLPSDAGVKIYNYAANSARLQEQVNSAQIDKAEATKVLASKTASQPAKAKASNKLHQISELEKASADAVRGITDNVGDKQFVAGFGNNGGEEFLSYMNISETLLAKGGKEWETWNKKTTDNVNRVQNTDGSWSGSHCITGRTFCTAAALLTLMADRAPVPTAADVASKK